MPRKNTADSLHDQYVGKLALLTVETSLHFFVKIIDAREKFGRVDVLVTSNQGTGMGERWVSAERVAVQK